MFDNLIALGYGIVVFAIIIGVGSIVLYNFAGSVAGCETGYTYTTSTGLCTNGSGTTATPSGAGYTNTAYMLTQLGTTGLAGWVPAVVAISVGLLFLGAFMIGKGRKGRY